LRLVENCKPQKAQSPNLLSSHCDAEGVTLNGQIVELYHDTLFCFSHMLVLSYMMFSICDCQGILFYAMLLCCFNVNNVLLSICDCQGILFYAMLLCCFNVNNVLHFDKEFFIFCITVFKIFTLRIALNVSAERTHNLFSLLITLKFERPCDILN
jgi:hypothetical protein